MKSWKAAVLTATGMPVSLVQARAPIPLGLGQLLVAVSISGLCATQLHEIDGRRGEDRFLPHFLGHEAIGRVVDIGPGVTRFQIGDQVVAHWRKGTGLDGGPIVLDTELGPVNGGPITTFSEFSIISENRLTRLPAGLDPATGVLLGCSMTTGFGAVVHEARVQPGESTLVIGLGGVGISILKTLNLVAAHPVGVVDISQDKVDLATQLGADIAVNAGKLATGSEEDLEMAVGFKPKVIFECTGVKSVIENAYKLLADDGRLVLVGVPSKAEPATFDTLPLHLGKSIIGSHGGSSNPTVDIPRVSRLIFAGKLKVEDIPVQEFALQDINEALTALRLGTRGRVLIRM